MRRVLFVALTLLTAVPTWTPSVRASDTPKRKPLDTNQRAALVVLINAVDAAQQREADEAQPSVAWDSHIIKSRDQTAYVPFTLMVNAAGDTFKSALVYVRAVSRHDGYRVAEERSSMRDWLARGGDLPSPRRETVFVGPGEMPVGGPAMSSSRQSTRAPAEALAVLNLQQREFERQKALTEAARKKAETGERDPYLFPFEDYHFVDMKSSRGGDSRLIERALALPAGEYDVFVAIVDRARVATSSPVVIRRTVVIPDYWNDRLALSSLMLVSSITTLKAPLPATQQSEHPYTFGRAEVVTVRTPSFTTADVLSVAYQVCNYGSPDSDLIAEYDFYHDVDGTRTLFNRTMPQEMTDNDLPPTSPWETQAFLSQSVALHAFPPGQVRARSDGQGSTHSRRRQKRGRVHCALGGWMQGPRKTNHERSIGNLATAYSVLRA